MLKAFETLQNNLEVDTDVASSQIELLERSNIATTLKYQSVNEQLENTVTAAADLSSAKEAFKNIDQSLNEAENYANFVDNILKELDQWVSELDVKSRRLCERKSAAQ